MSDELPEHELIRLKQVVTRRTRASLLVAPGLSASEVQRLDELVARRLAGEPLQYLEGSVSFGGLEIAVDRRALIPRPETEELFELAAGAAAFPGVIVDLGTGSGNLALALKHRFPEAVVYATDVDEAALDLAAENASRLGLDIRLSCGDLFAALPDELAGTVDLMVANPPYVADGDGLPAVVRDHEPAVSLFAGSDGLDVIRRTGEEAALWLAPGGLVAIEVGSGQATAAAASFAGLEATVHEDLAGYGRFVVGRLRSGE